MIVDSKSRVAGNIKRLPILLQNRVRLSVIPNAVRCALCVLMVSRDERVTQARDVVWPRTGSSHRGTRRLI